jgi:FdhE protein
MTLEAWLKKHEYLRPVAELSAQVESALAGVAAARASIPSWDDYAADFHEGVPLLQSLGAAIDLEPAGTMVRALVEKLASTGSLPGRVAAEIQELAHALRRDGNVSQHIVSSLLGEEVLVPASPGLLRYLGWTAMARYLRPVVDAFAGWRDEERWLRSYCPTCGSPPAMAQLVGADPGRKRFLCCGCCATRWQYGRTCCPFCENDSHRLAIVGLESEAGAALRIDHCESCRGYLKTYDGHGNERLFLADWTSLHLDLIAHDRGLKRVAVSLYELDLSQRHESSS